MQSLILTEQPTGIRQRHGHCAGDGSGDAPCGSSGHAAGGQNQQVVSYTYGSIRPEITRERVAHRRQGRSGRALCGVAGRTNLDAQLILADPHQRRRVTIGEALFHRLLQGLLTRGAN